MLLHPHELRLAYMLTLHDSMDHQKCLADADELKLEGTEHFRAQEWPQALAKYKSALARLPKRPSLEEPRPYEQDTEPGDTGEQAGDVPSSKKKKDGEKVKVESPPLMGLQLECAKARAVLNANIGACHVKLVRLIPPLANFPSAHG